MNPRLHSTSFEENLRSVRKEVVSHVMNIFFVENKIKIDQKNNHEIIKNSENNFENDTYIQCEEILTETAQK